MTIKYEYAVIEHSNDDECIWGQGRDLPGALDLLRLAQEQNKTGFTFSINRRLIQDSWEPFDPEDPGPPASLGFTQWEPYEYPWQCYVYDRDGKPHNKGACRTQSEAELNVRRIGMMWRTQWQRTAESRTEVYPEPVDDSR